MGPDLRQESPGSAPRREIRPRPDEVGGPSDGRVRSRRGRALHRHGPPALLGILLAAAMGRHGQPLLGCLFAVSALFVWAVLPAVGRWFRKARIVVRPGGRSAHQGAIPLCGGLVVFVPFAVLTAGRVLGGDVHALGLLAGATLMLLVGFLDDLKGTPARLKLLAQLLAGSLLLATGYRADVLGIPGLATIHLGAFGALFLLAWVILATNAYNVIDGMDGIAGAAGIVALSGLAYLGVHDATVALLAGALLGFFAWNLPRARVFLGDAGTMFLGFVLAALMLDLPPTENVPLVAALFAYPLGDAGFVSLRRLVRGKSIFRGDTSHTYHELARRLGNRRRAIAAVLLLAATAAATGLARPGGSFLVWLLVAWALLSLLLATLGRVHPGRLVRNRKHFRALERQRRHALRTLRDASSEEDVRDVLAGLVESLGLVEVRMGDLVVRTVRSREGSPRVERVPLRRKRAVCVFAAREADEDAALRQERITVLHEILRAVEARCGELHAERHAEPSKDGRFTHAGRRRRREHASAPLAQGPSGTRT